MRFLADECLHVEIVAALRQAGHEVATVAPADTGASDEQVLERAARERAILRTADKDFGEIGVARAAGLSGIVLFGDPSQTPRAPLRACSRLSRSMAIPCTADTPLSRRHARGCAGWLSLMPGVVTEFRVADVAGDEVLLGRVADTHRDAVGRRRALDDASWGDQAARLPAR